MKNFFVMDIETFEDLGKVVPYLFVLKTPNDSLSFFYESDGSMIPNFLNFVEKESIKLCLEKACIFTHNINFDGFILIEYFLENAIPFKWFLRNLNLYFLSFTYKGFPIEIRCSYKILGCSVAKLGFLLNEPKKIFPYKFVNKSNLNFSGPIPEVYFFDSLEDRIQFKKIWGDFFNLKEVIIDYALRDVNIVESSLNEVFKISKKNSFSKSYSFSSYSYKLFKSKYDTKKICINRLSVQERNFIENSYFGGRTEIFGNTLDGIIHRFDFPGMYGSCMKEKFPYGKTFIDNPKDFNYPGFYTVTVKSQLKIPILPIRSSNGKIIYPNGTFTTCLSRDEFIFFIEKGGKIEKIHSALLFENEDYVFKEFVEDFDKIKSKGGFHKLYGKQVINSLYGSFALRRDNNKYVILYSENELNFLEKEFRLKSFMKYGKIIIACVQNDSFLNPREDRNISYASFISSKARIKLHKNVFAVDDHYTKKYGSKYKLLYLETDSIDVSLPENCLNESVLDVRWDKIYKKGVFISPKFYYLSEDGRPKIKGVSDSKYEYEEISDLFYKNENNLIFKDQLQFLKKDFKLAQKYTDKVLKISSYDKRIFSKDKLSTEPIVIGNS